MAHFWRPLNQCSFSAKQIKIRANSDGYTNNRWDQDKEPASSSPVCRIPHETTSVTMMLYRNTKSMIHSPDGDTNIFNILAGVLQGGNMQGPKFDANPRIHESDSQSDSRHAVSCESRKIRVIFL